MKKITGLLACLLLILNVSGQEIFPKAFKDRLIRANMEFNQPDSFVVVPVIQNKHLLYEYAVKHNNKNVEIRYIVNPLDDQLKTYNEFIKNKKPGEVYVNPNKSYLSYFFSILINISTEPPSSFTSIDSQRAQASYNADWAGFQFVKLNKEFGQNYKYCMVVALHKNDFGDAYCIYLSDEKNEMIHSAYLNNFSSLKFKK